MTPEEQIIALQNRLEKLEQTVNLLVRPDRYVFERPIVGGANGLKVGSSGQKIGFYGVAPVVKATTAPTLATQGGGYVQADVQSIVTAVNSIKVTLTNLGLTT